MSSQEDMTGALVPLGGGDDIPAPTDLKKQLVDSMETHVVRIRADRGEVTNPSDTFDLIRRLTAVQERMGDYQRAFGSVAKTAKDYLEEELFEAVHEQDGIPMSNLTVPTAGGDIQLKRNTENVYDIDMGQVVAVIAARLSGSWGVEEGGAAARPEEFAIAVALEALAFFSAPKPKVTAVRALAVQLAREGDDKLAGVALDAISKKVKYKGITVERKAS